MIKDTEPRDYTSSSIRTGYGTGPKATNDGARTEHYGMLRGGAKKPAGKKPAAKKPASKKPVSKK